MQCVVRHPFCLASGTDGVTHSKQMSWRSCKPSVAILSMPPGTLRLPLMYPMSWHSICQDTHTHTQRSSVALILIPKVGAGCSQWKHSRCNLSKIWAERKPVFRLISYYVRTENKYEIKVSYTHITLYCMCSSCVCQSDSFQQGCVAQLSRQIYVQLPSNMKCVLLLPR